MSRRCPACKKLFDPTFNTLQKVCSPKCAIAYAPTEQAEKDYKKARKHETRAMREANKTLKTVYKEEQRSINAYVRARDNGKGCISCPQGVVIDAGHFIAVGSKYQCNPFRLDVRQIHGQCKKCNHFDSGNRVGYEAGIIERYGQGYLDELLALEFEAQNNPELLTKEEIRAEGKRYRKLTRELLK